MPSSLVAWFVDCPGGFVCIRSIASCNAQQSGCIGALTVLGFVCALDRLHHVMHSSLVAWCVDCPGVVVGVPGHRALDRLHHVKPSSLVARC